MKFGALLTDTQGNPFYVDGTLPLSLASKTTYPIGDRTVHANDGALRFVFCNSTTANVNFYYYYDSASNTYKINASGTPGSTFTVYIFSYQYQTPPPWGVAIWDEQGRCIITHETKVLRGVVRVGTPGAESAGYNINTTLAGNYAVAPEMLGYITGVVYQGNMPYPFLAPFFTSAYYNGSSTVIKAVGRGDSGGGGAGNITNINYRNAIKAIDITNY
ncbi:hypothetical protein [[Erwinia] mediterraneensis]|uniref:hypothetical protein n=1 Tax=[Erwinia] mediterraneensis TaxID=2161819 RepID=UPI001031AA66|nr:hypothetical protein [[Erwinia] mediterraneensis]